MVRMNNRLNIYLSELERRALREKARIEHCSESYVVRMLIRTYLADYARPPTDSEKSSAT